MSERLIDLPWWETPAYTQPRLFEVPDVTTPLIALHPELIEVAPVDVRRVVHLQREMSRVKWRPSPGRNRAYIVHQEGKLIGICFLSSPVFALRARDEFLRLPIDKKLRGRILRHYADLSVCVGAQPLAWHWNAGKLIAQIATTLGDDWVAAYGDQLVGLTTTSVWGKGSQYNRLWRFLGYTQGFGNCHIPDAVYQQMVAWMDRNQVARHHHTESHVRMRNVGRFRRAVGSDLTTLTQFHGEKRAIYYAAARPSGMRKQVIQDWFERWGSPRYERTKDLEPPYRSGIA